MHNYVSDALLNPYSSILGYKCPQYMSKGTEAARSFFTLSEVQNCQTGHLPAISAQLHIYPQPAARLLAESAWRPCQLPAAQDVQMQVEHRLACT